MSSNTEWQAAVADLMLRSPWSPSEQVAQAHHSWREALMQLFADTGIKNAPIERLLVKPATALEPVALFALRLYPTSSSVVLFEDQRQALILRKDMTRGSQGLILYEFPAAALTGTQRDLLFEYVGETTEAELQSVYKNALITLV